LEGLGRCLEEEPPINDEPVPAEAARGERVAGADEGDV
jgi:hypothetical protein